MTIYPEDSPKTFREVGIILRNIMEKIEDLELSQKKNSNLLITSIVSIVGSTITIIASKWF